MKKSFLLLTLFFIGQILYSQKNYRPGFILNLNKDTIVGSVNYSEGINSYQYCTFKERGGENPIRYTPKMISGYGFFNDKIFEVQNLDTLEGSLGFFEVIARGRVSLLRYDKSYYVQKGDSAVMKISNELKEVLVDGNYVNMETKQYIGLLSWLLHDCADIQPDEIQSTSLSERSLTKLFLHYNKCKGSPIIEYNQRKPWTKIDFGFQAGMVKSNYDIVRRDYYLKKLYSSLDPFVGIKLGISSPKFSEKISFQTEIQFTHSDYNSSKSLTQMNVTQKYDFDFDVNTLSLPLSFMYSTLGKWNSWFIQAGIIYDRQIKSDANLKITESVHNVFPTDEIIVTTKTSTPFGFERNLFGYWGGIGYLRKFNNFDCGITLRYYASSNPGMAVNINERMGLSLIFSFK